MKFLRSHFALSRSQQNGIFVLVLLIIIFQVLLVINIFPEEEPEAISDEAIQVLQQRLDSINLSKNAQRDTIYAFNPNFITDFKGYQLGMSVEQIDRLLAYRALGKWVNTAEDFQKVTGVSDSLLKKLKPSFRFPEWTKKEANVRILSTKDSLPVMRIDLNIATPEDLKAINGVGEVLSQRIVKYRRRIGGFLHLMQLKDVYGLSPEVLLKIEKRFYIQSRPDLELKSLNSITVSELAEIPYFNDHLAREIIRYRNLHEGISSFEELAKIDGFPSDKIDRIKLYLALR